MLTQHYLSSLFQPKSVAVIGASEREHSVGNVIFKNILDSCFKGELHAVNPSHGSILGQVSYKSVEKIGGRVDLAVIATRPHTVPRIMEQCGRSGVRNAIIIASGFSEASNAGAALERKVVEIARTYNVRILGPNCLGIIRPDIGLNATFTKVTAEAGDLALVSQSGAMCSAVLDWAESNKIGFSSVISLGVTVDVDFGEILDYLIYDDRTRYILMYVEGIRNARRFISALRSAARAKPIILLKAGRHEFGAQAAVAHSGMAAVADSVFDAVVRRTGAVRVQNVGQLFSAAKALSSRFHPRGDRLAIVTNGGGPGAMAADRAGDLSIPLARLSQSTFDKLNKILPRDWPRANPIDIGGDAAPECYRETILTVAGDPNVDSTLVMLSPQAMTDPVKVSQEIIDLDDSVRTAISCCWMGGRQLVEARQMLEKAGIPVFHTPDTVIELFHTMSKYYRSQKLLLQTPSPIRKSGASVQGGARVLVEALLGERRTLLSDMESKAILRAFGVPVTQTMVAHSATEALFVAQQIGFPVAMKVDSPDLRHKSDAGGVRLNIGSAQSVLNAFHDIVATVQDRQPDARITGVSIEPYLSRPNGRELMIGVLRDPLFGPMITFGAGGFDAQFFNERSLALPPLNQFLARDLIDSNQVARLLGPVKKMPPVNLDALTEVLICISEMVCELPWLKELDLNPLIVDENGAIAADARIVIDHTLGNSDDRYAHMAIHPYPAHLTQVVQLPDGRSATIRPVRPEDAELEREFVKDMSEESRYFRFMEPIRELPSTMVVRFTQIDYDREMALVATIVGEDGVEKQIGNARYVLTPDGQSVEFALAIGDDWQKCGLGRRLMSALIDYARSRGYRAMVGDVLANNSRLFRMVQRLGFTIHPHPELPAAKRVVKPLYN
ncbi:bifunctional acetyl coenzyme A synthetase (ADP forming), alpha domain/GNAT family N-acetyltransferase [Accumulibacter sp.]|uniref:bifunctional acetate--CoA ligase family protein/GNAT family N-acetyltransferase n=1 Tax=Accumulibacter sp. TaxID=2053492 RepID=UPI002617758D|nr:bifunctional acetyl coenzyme A synthetase (ADP forming), alpha domain/GNAT family N-acetyltransferase [Accumulibacter sp.]